MSRYETGDRNSTDFFRWHSIWTVGDQIKEDYSGEYRTLKSVTAGIRYDKKINAKYHPHIHKQHKIQKLVPVYAYPPYLEWQDLEDILDY